MTIISSKRQQKLIKKFDIKYNPNKRLQYLTTFGNKEAYLNNIKEAFKTLGKYILFSLGSALAVITFPFIFIWILICCIQSFIPYSLVYTKRKIKDNENDFVETGKFKKVGENNEV